MPNIILEGEPVCAHQTQASLVQREVGFAQQNSEGLFLLSF